MKKVDLIGVGMTQFGKHSNKTSRDLLVDATREAIASVDKGIDLKKDINVR